MSFGPAWRWPRKGWRCLPRGVTPESRAFVDNAFRDGAIPSTGTAITKILPPASRFSAGNAHALKKLTVLDKLTAFFDRFFGLT